MTDNVETPDSVGSVLQHYEQDLKKVSSAIGEHLKTHEASQGIVEVQAKVDTALSLVTEANTHASDLSLKEFTDVEKQARDTITAAVCAIVSEKAPSSVSDILRDKGLDIVAASGSVIDPDMYGRGEKIDERS